MTQSTNLDHNHEYRRLICNHCATIVDVPVRCGNRFCPVCNKSRLSRIRKKLQGVLHIVDPRPGYSFRHLTLSTTNHVTTKDGIEWLLKSFRRLRQRSFWKSHVIGGCYVFEVTSSGSGFHVHIHAIIYARWLNYETLLKLWNHCSGGLSCYIQTFPKSKILNYLTKYLTKTNLKAEAQELVSKDLKNKRLVSFFGELHGLAQKVKISKFKCTECNCGTFVPLEFVGRIYRNTGT